MRKPTRKQQKPHPKPVADTRDYPTLREHLTSRRDLLTWMGASVVTSLWVGCVMGDDDSGPAYYTARLPSEGSDLVTQAGGGSLRYYVNITVEHDYGYYSLLESEVAALEACRLELAEHDFALLAAATQGGNREPYYEAERALQTALWPYLCEASCWSVTVALTIEEFVP